MREWGKYDPTITQAIMRELPKSWGELWASPSLKTHVKSKLTLSTYLTYLKKKGAIRRVVDQKTDTIVYVPNEDLPEDEKKKLAASRWLRVIEAREKDFDIERLYWGGHEDGWTRWWEQVRDRAKHADPSLVDAANTWFKEAYGSKFESDPLEAIVLEMIQDLVYEWMNSSLFYLMAVFGEKEVAKSTTPMDRNKAPLTFNMLSFLQHAGLWQKLWWNQGPRERLLDAPKHHIALLALAIKAGCCTLPEIMAVLERTNRRLYDKKGLVLAPKHAGPALVAIDTQPLITSAQRT